MFNYFLNLRGSFISLSDYSRETAWAYKRQLETITSVFSFLLFLLWNIDIFSALTSRSLCYSLACFRGPHHGSGIVDKQQMCRRT